MAKRKETAKEFMARLEVDPAYQERIAAKEAQFAKLNEELVAHAKPVLADLKNLGYEGTSIQQIVNRYAPLPADLVDRILWWIDRATHRRLIEGLARALAASGVPFDGSVLQRRFNETDDEGLRWAIGNTVACAKPTGVDEWIDTLRQRPDLKGVFAES